MDKEQNWLDTWFLSVQFDKETKNYYTVTAANKSEALAAYKGSGIIDMCVKIDEEL